ncbi:MAG TPA: hypothetical protein VF789_13120 [Thermoanaerobaculia bacterium]
MTKDPIFEEVRAGRDAYAKKHGYDIKAIVAALQQEEAKSGREVISLPPKRLVSEPQTVRKVG